MRRRVEVGKFRFSDSSVPRLNQAAVGGPSSAVEQGIYMNYSSHLYPTPWRYRRADVSPHEQALDDLLRALGVNRPVPWGAPMLPRCAAESRTGAAEETGLSLRVGAIRTFIDAHADEPIDLDRIAGAAGLSKFHLVRLFREATGTTPWAYVQDVRVRKARTLLESDLSLAEVALQSGFYDQSHFTRAFREAEGETPGRYRKRRKNIQDRAAVRR